MVKAGVTTNRVPSSEKKICLTPCRRQDVVQAFISGSSIILVPCCIVTQAREHFPSSTEWHMHRQQSPRSRSSAGRETPVNGNAARITAKIAVLGPLIIDVPNRFISQIKAPIRCILYPFGPLRQMTVVINRAGLYAQTPFFVSGFQIKSPLLASSRHRRRNQAEIPPILRSCRSWQIMCKPQCNLRVE